MISSGSAVRADKNTTDELDLVMEKGSANFSNSKNNVKLFEGEFLVNNDNALVMISSAKETKFLNQNSLN